LNSFGLDVSTEVSVQGALQGKIAHGKLAHGIRLKLTHDRGGCGAKKYWGGAEGV